MPLLSEKVQLFLKFIPFFLAYIPELLLQKVEAIVHRFTYKATADAKTVVVIGGSFAGFFTAQRLIQSLPTGYKLILIEKNEHLHYVFNFPRFSVLKGKERAAFIPFDGLEKIAPTGIYERKQATVEKLEQNKLVLETGEEIGFEYCIIATGAKQPFPARLEVSTTDAAYQLLKHVQSEVEHAKSIAVIGSGAVGVEMATDIKAYHPNKQVTLVSSRNYLLPSFGSKLREYALDATKKLGVNVVLNARPHLQPTMAGENGRLVFEDGNVEEYDLVIPCTGQTPNSSILASLSPKVVTENSGRILVDPTLRVADPSLPGFFAIGDVAETGGPKMGRAAFFQANIVAHNILSLIKGRALKQYLPNVGMEGAIKLTLGKTDYAMYTQDADGTELLAPGSSGPEDLGIARAWRMYGVRCDKLLLGETKKAVKA